MKKLIIALAATALSVSTYAMSKMPADANTAEAAKACVVKEACSAEAKAACPKAETKKAVEEKTGCAGGICPLTK